MTVQDDDLVDNDDRPDDDDLAFDRYGDDDE